VSGSLNQTRLEYDSEESLSSGMNFRIGIFGLLCILTAPIMQAQARLAITSLSPSSATAGGAGFTLTINGSGFVSTAQVRWNEGGVTTTLVPTFVSSTQLTASIPANLIATAGTSNITVALATASSNSVAFTINPPAPLSIVCSPTTGPVEVGLFYSAMCLAAGGTQPYSWAEGGVVGCGINCPPVRLPTGISLSSSTGSMITVSGAPTTPGGYLYGIQVTDSTACVLEEVRARSGLRREAAAAVGPCSQSQSQGFSGTIIAGPTVSTTSLPSGTVGIQYSAPPLQASGGTSPYSNWSVISGSFPPGLTLNASTGAITGTPTSATGSPFNFAVTVTDSLNVTSPPQLLSIVITQGLTINCATPSPATAGTQYSTSCTASGGTPGYTWTTQSALPSWLTGTPSGATYTLSGTPPTPPPSSYTIGVIVSDSTSPTRQTQTQTITITVGASTLTINCRTPGPATAGTAYSTSCTASGGTPGYTWTTQSALPSWLTGTPSGATYTLSGTPPTPPPSSYTIGVIVSDSTTPTKQTQTQTITITVGASALSINCSTPGPATAGTPYSTSCTASGGTPGYTWTTQSALPSWLTGTPSGATYTLSGTPPIPPPSSYTIGVIVSDSTTPTKQTQTQTITITIPAQPVQVTITQTSISNNQTSLLVSFAQAAQSNYTGTLSLSFQHDPGVTNVPANYVDPAGGFAASGSTTALTQNFTINQGATQASVPFALGTVAGTWTVAVTALNTGGSSVLPSPAPTYPVAVPIAAPLVVGSAQIVGATSSGFTVQLTGIASSRSVSSATFLFTPASGAKLQGTSVTVPFNGVDQSQWFNTPASQGYGGTFSLALPFSYSGDASALGSVSVTLAK